MRLFKNRGDIFFSKTDKKKSTEQKFLLASLALIVIFTIVFVIFTGVKNDFSVKTFFKPDKLDITESNSQLELELPQISGKDNFLIILSDDSDLLFTYLLQVDKDATAYKLTTIRPDTLVDGKSLGSIFAASGEKNVLSAITALLDIDVDYYISFDRQRFIEVFDNMGAVKYPLLEDIRYKSTSATPFTLRLREGEQSIKGAKAVDLVRYFLETDKDSQANDFLLTCLTQQLNTENYARSEQLFHLFIKNAGTNITIREFSACDDTLVVLCSERSGVKIYNAPATYKDNTVTKDSLKKIKGYYVK